MEDASIFNNWFIGEDKGLIVTIYQTVNGVMTATPQNISGWQLRYDLRLTAESPGPALLTKSTGAGITITDAPNGVLQIRIDSSDTDALDALVYTHALKRTESGSETVLFTGTALLQRATTL
jgi:hypothetical protein